MHLTDPKRLDMAADAYARKALTGPDGAQSKVSVFTVGARLYVLEAKVAAAEADDVGPDAIRFQQSMRFSGGRLGSGPALQPVCRGRAREASTVG